MKKILVAVIFLVVFLFSCVRCRPTLTHPDNLYHLSRATAAITSDLNPGDPICAGVFISETELLTANHCILTRFAFEISDENTHQTRTFILTSTESPIGTVFHVVNHPQLLEDWTLNTYSDFTVEFADQARDLALLRAVDPNYHAPEFATIRDESSGLPRVGDGVVTIGHPIGQMFNVTPGIISSRPILSHDVVYMLPSCPIYFGNSGGPLFDENGQLIGVAHTMRGEVSHLGQFVSYLDVREFLEENSL